MTVTKPCPECDATFERETETEAANSVIGHMVSKKDDAHQGIGYEKAHRLISISDAEADITESTDPPAQTATTDGGPERQTPPTPEVTETTNEPEIESADDLPDRYVATDSYVDAARGQGLSDDRAAKLAETLAPFDVVDVEQTTDTNLAAYELSEVPHE